MSDAGMNHWGNRGELTDEWAELLPDRTTLAAVGTSRYGFSPTNAAVNSPTSSNFPIGSPASNNAVVNTVSQPQVSGGYMPVVITFMPTINIIVQQSSPDSFAAGHHAGDSPAASAPGSDLHPESAQPGGGQWLDLIRRLFGM
ncbi:hypothetical protein [Pseudofrankia sp. DC12]|uniref:hypothetical protein n=1 Tax=Pseudofrankia sp. DC12 TaxID=683315 RepID=UPI0005F7A13C|nr:hypothetical protein [Pseudofrankia sp. DC12]